MIDLYLVTDDARYREAADSASSWLRQSEIEPGRWARFYEIGSNRAIFADRAGVVHSTLEDLPIEERLSYRWQGGRDTFPDVGLALDRMAALDSGTEAVDQYDRAFQQTALLPFSPTARVSPRASQSTYERGPLVSSRDIVETCASIVVTE